MMMTTKKSGDVSMPDTRRRILDAAVDVIDAGGEASLRVTDVAARAGIATGLIHHHFGSREGLVSAAQVWRHSRVISEDIERFRKCFTASESQAETIAALNACFSSVTSRDQAPNRLVRISALGAAHGRSDLRADLAEAIATSIDLAAEVLRVGQESGLVRTHVDARAAATVLIGFGTGLVIADFDARPSSSDDLAEVLVNFVGSLIIPAVDP
jgi:AcrR family transcriptional regulator